MSQHVFFVGTESEVAHHAAPLAGKVDFEIVSADDVLDSCRQGDLAVFFTEHFDRFRDAIQRLKSAQVATLYMIDGILEWRNAWENRSDEPACPFAMRPILSHKAACIGYSQARILHSWGNAGKVEIVGVPRFDRLLPKAISTSGNEPPTRVLVMTAKCPAYTDEQEKLLVNSLRDVKHVFEYQKNIEPVWRLTKGLDKRLEVENHLNEFSGVELAKLLETVDAVITTPSTAALEAMLLDKPTAILDYNPCPSYFNTAWNIKSSEHIESVINELAEPPEAKMFFQRQCLSFELCHDGRSTERLAGLINGMLKVSRDSAGQDLAFPEQMLQLVANPSFPFDHAKTYPEFSDFRVDDVSQLQTELAHSRREINHLQSQLNQIQSELKQAHQIFDEINSHPIAGPIVKLRQKWFDLMRKLKIVKNTQANLID